jgi:hypothetical protein
MNTVQLGIRIPANLNERLTTFMEQTGISLRSLLVPWHHIWGVLKKYSLTERMASLEANMAQLEAMLKSK